MKYFSIILVVLSAAVAVSAAAEIPDTAGNVSSKGFTRIDFCNADGKLYAFNGLDVYCYSALTDSFNVAFANAGYATSSVWDPADFAFMSDCNNVVLPTGESGEIIYIDRQANTATKQTSLYRNYYSTASRYRAGQLFANGVGGSINNTIYRLDINAGGTETQVAEISNTNSGAIAFDFADNLYVADFKPVFDGSGLGNVDIYRISRGQLDAFAEDNNFEVRAELIVNNVLLAGSDSMVVDADYNIYMGSYVGIAKITPTGDVNNFSVSAVDGNIYANPHGFPWPGYKFSGITADIRTGKIYYGKSRLNESYIYEPYILNDFQVAAAVDWSADLDGDGIVDFYDLALFYDKGDLNDDGNVNYLDYAIFASQWQNKSPWYKGI